MISVVAVEDRPGTITWQRRCRYAAATVFVGSSLLWFVSNLVSWAGHGVGRVPFTQAHPHSSCASTCEPPVSPPTPKFPTSMAA
jgi:hypothetical protein